MGQGRENVRVFLRENKDIREKIENTLRKKMEIPFPGQTRCSSGERPDMDRMAPKVSRSAREDGGSSFGSG